MPFPMLAPVSASVNPWLTQPGMDGQAAKVRGDREFHFPILIPGLRPDARFGGRTLHKLSTGAGLAPLQVVLAPWTSPAR